MSVYRRLALFTLFFSPLAAAVPPAEGTCICDSFGCSKVVNGMWTHVGACPASGGQMDMFNGPVLAKKNAEHHLASLMNGDLVVVENQALNYNEWSDEGDWKKSDMNGPKTGYGWIGPDGKKYDSPEQGWHMRGGRAEPATIRIGAVDSALRVSLDYDKTDFSGITRQSRDAALRVRYSRDWDDWGLALEAPLANQSNSANYGNLDNTSLGITAMPVYHLMRAGVHGLDADLAGIAGYSRHWYKGGTALAVAGFDNPGYLEVGVMAAMRKRAKFAKMKLGLSYEQVEDQSGASMAGRRNLGFSGLQAGLQIPVRHAFELGADLGYSYIHGLPAGMDASSWKGSLSLQYQGKLLNYGVGFGRTFGNIDYRTTGFNLWLSRVLK